MGGPETASVEAAEKQVMAELNRVRDAVSENAPLVSELEKRLSDVLMDESSKDGAVPEAPEKLFCPLAGMLRSVRRDMREQTDQLRSIMRRLEL